MMCCNSIPNITDFFNCWATCSWERVTWSGHQSIWRRRSDSDWSGGRNISVFSSPWISSPPSRWCFNYTPLTTSGVLCPGLFSGRLLSLWCPRARDPTRMQQERCLCLLSLWRCICQLLLIHFLSVCLLLLLCFCSVIPWHDPFQWQSRRWWRLKLPFSRWKLWTELYLGGVRSGILMIKNPLHIEFSLWR